MADSQPITRRSALTTLASAGLFAGVAGTASGFWLRAETHDGVVDRIVDGTHVVVLVQADGDVIDQVVVDHAEYPSLAEGDSVTVEYINGSFATLIVEDD